MTDQFEDFKKEAPTLVFDAAPKEPEKKPVPEKKEILNDSMLSKEERQQVDAFAEQIDLRNSGAVLHYGVGTQKKLADFSERALNNVRTKDMGEVGNMIAGLVTELRSFDAEEESRGFFGFLKKGESKLSMMKVKYNKVETNVNEIVKVLENHQIQLMKDIDVLDRMYEMNLTYFKELTMYILAGKKKLHEVRSAELPALQQKAQKSGLPEDAQEARDLADLCERFEKKLYDTYRSDPDGAADPYGAERGYADGRKDPVYDCQYDSALEEPDGDCDWRGAFRAGGKGAAGSDRYDKRAA